MLLIVVPASEVESLLSCGFAAVVEAAGSGFSPGVPSVVPVATAAFVVLAVSTAAAITTGDARPAGDSDSQVR